MSTQPSVSTYHRLPLKFDEPKIDLSTMKVPVSQENEPKNNDEIRMRHCEDIYSNLCENVKHPFFSNEQNKDQIMGQLKQQIDYIYSRRYAKRRVG